MEKVLCFLYDGFVDFEISLVCHYINEVPRYEVIYIAYDKLPIKNAGGMTVTPDNAISEINTLEEIHGLIFPGGVKIIVKPELENLVKILHKQKKLIAAICGGPEFLAKIGILDGKKYTTSNYPHEYEEKNEVDPFPRETFVEARVVRDENIITAKGNAFVDFTLEIWDWLDMYDYETEKEECKVMFSPK